MNIIYPRDIKIISNDKIVVNCIELSPSMVAIEAPDGMWTIAHSNHTDRNCLPTTRDTGLELLTMMQVATLSEIPGIDKYVQGNRVTIDMS